MNPIDAAFGARVLVRSGLLDLSRPGLVLRSLALTRKLGPIAGPVALSALRNPDDVAIIDDAGSLSYGQLVAASNALARGLAEGGVRPGTAVGVLCRDHREAVEAMVATALIGAKLVLLNTGFAGPQLRDVCAREGVAAVIADAEFANLLDGLTEVPRRYFAGAASAHGHTTVAELIAGQPTDDLPLPDAQGGLVLLTGGTTGTPKGAPRQVTSPFAAAQFLERIPQRRGDVVLVAAPTFHGTGLSQMIMAFALGSTVVMQRRFDPLATVKKMARHRATMLVLVPTMLNRILALGDEVLDEYETSSLRIIMSAGAALPTELGNRATERFGDVIHNFYGCTEVALATVATPEDWRAAPGTVGRPPRGIKVELFDELGRVVRTAGSIGTIYVDNGLKFSGYSGGGGKKTIGTFMSTGDTGHWDSAGRLFVDGRDDDMIVSGGENLFPGEVEDLVAAMPGVSEAAMLPVPDADFGTRLRAFVVGDGTRELTAEDVTAHVRANLARFKVPRDVWFVERLPYTAAGKLDRRALAGMKPLPTGGGQK